MLACRVGDAGPRPRSRATAVQPVRLADTELRAEHRAETDTALPQARRRLSELRHPVHAIVIGDGQRREASLGYEVVAVALDQLLWWTKVLKTARESGGVAAAA